MEGLCVCVTQGVDRFLQTSYGQQRFDLRPAKICIGNTPR
jgi:hypothetical protein